MTGITPAMWDDGDEDITHDHNANAPGSLELSQAMCRDDEVKNLKFSVTTSVSPSRSMPLDSACD